MIRFFLFLGLSAAALVGFGFGSGHLSKGKGVKVIAKIHPEKEFPMREFKSFVIVLFAHNDAAWGEEALRSVFAQDYDYFRVLFVDDGSQDNTFEKVKEFVIANQQEHRVILMRNEIELGAVASFYRIASYCQDREVVVPLFLSDWFAGSKVLSSLNQAFQNPDVWIACGKTLSYPSYEFLDLPEWKKIEKQGYADYQGLSAFYAALLKQLPLQHTFTKGFSLIPLLELAGGRVKNIFEPLSFRNLILPRVSPPPISRHFSPLAAFPESKSRPFEADVVLFSNDRPLQLFSVLESIQQFTSGVYRVSVFYRASDPFISAYDQMKEVFPDVVFLTEEERLTESPTEYVLLAKDEWALKGAIDLDLCIEAMEKTHADNFCLNAIELPADTMTLSDQLVAFTPQKAPSMALMRKSFFKECKQMKDALERKFLEKSITLTFKEPKTVQLPLDSSEEWLTKFYQGFKIDLPSLEFEGPPDFVPR
jgi:hypothetical protein